MLFRSRARPSKTGHAGRSRRFASAGEHLPELRHREHVNGAARNGAKERSFIWETPGRTCPQSYHRRRSRRSDQRADSRGPPRRCDLGTRRLVLSRDRVGGSSGHGRGRERDVNDRAALAARREPAAQGRHRENVKHAAGNAERYDGRVHVQHIGKSRLDRHAVRRSALGRGAAVGATARGDGSAASVPDRKGSGPACLSAGR